MIATLYSHPRGECLGKVTDCVYRMGEPKKHDVRTLDEPNAEPMDGLRTDTIEFTAPAFMAPGDFVLVDGGSGEKWRICTERAYLQGDQVSAVAYPAS